MAGAIPLPPILKFLSSLLPVKKVAGFVNRSINPDRFSPMEKNMPPILPRLPAKTLAWPNHEQYDNGGVW
jgi:hypothetical protein